MNGQHPTPTATGIEHDTLPDAYVERHDWAGDVPLSATVTSLVATAAEVDPTDLDPLNDVVDPDALDKLFAPREDGTPRTPGAVSFEFGPFDVRIGEDGAVRVTRR